MAAAPCYGEHEPVDAESFALTPKVIPICGRCGHKDSRHCKGGEQHSSMRGHGSTICVSRHCLEPLCSCVEFVEAS
jgi:hypothetical protein